VADTAAKLDAVHAWLQAHPGVAWAECDGVKLPQGEPIAQPASNVEAAPAESAEDAELRDLETLLYSSGGDASMFLSKPRVEQ